MKLYLKILMQSAYAPLRVELSRLGFIKVVKISVIFNPIDQVFDSKEWFIREKDQIW